MERVGSRSPRKSSSLMRPSCRSKSAAACAPKIPASIGGVRALMSRSLGTVKERFIGFRLEVSERGGELMLNSIAW